MIKLKELLNEIEENCVKKEGFVDDDNIEEYDVESEQDIKEFVQFMREYNQPLCEAELAGREFTEPEFESEREDLFESKFVEPLLLSETKE